VTLLGAAGEPVRFPLAEQGREPWEPTAEAVHASPPLARAAAAAGWTNTVRMVAASICADDVPAACADAMPKQRNQRAATLFEEIVIDDGHAVRTILRPE